MRNAERRKIEAAAGIALLLLYIAGCASHRAPPLCKGPYTPINASLTATAHDPQR
jgi:hypothetical protein